MALPTERSLLSSWSGWREAVPPLSWPFVAGTAVVATVAISSLGWCFSLSRRLHRLTRAPSDRSPFLVVAAPDSGCEPDPARSDSSGAATSVPPSSDLGGRVCEPILDSATAVLTPIRLEGLVAQTLPMEGP